MVSGVGACMGRKPLGFEVLYQEDVTGDYPDFPILRDSGVWASIRG